MPNIVPCLICGKTNFVKRDGKVRDNPQHLNVLPIGIVGYFFLNT